MRDVGISTNSTGEMSRMKLMLPEYYISNVFPSG